MQPAARQAEPMAPQTATEVAVVEAAVTLAAAAAKMAHQTAAEEEAEEALVMAQARAPRLPQVLELLLVLTQMQIT